MLMEKDLKPYEIFLGKIFKKEEHSLQALEKEAVVARRRAEMSGDDDDRKVAEVRKKDYLKEYDRLYRMTPEDEEEMRRKYPNEEKQEDYRSTWVYYDGDGEAHEYNDENPYFDEGNFDAESDDGFSLT